MDDLLHSSPGVVVGVDGSPAATSAALWAADEATSRGLALTLVHVIYQPGPDTAAVARAALAGAQRAVEAAPAPGSQPVRVQATVLRGNPLATLIELSRTAALVSVGSIGVAHTCHRAGSTAAALAGSADCPVAVIHQQPGGRRAGRIVAEVDAAPENVAVLGWAMAEARLRGAPLAVITSGDPALLQPRIENWVRRYPDVHLASVSRVDDVTGYLAEQADAIRLFVSGIRDRRSLGFTDDAGGCSVLTVGGGRR